MVRPVEIEEEEATDLEEEASWVKVGEIFDQIVEKVQAKIDSRTVAVNALKRALEDIE